MIKHTFKSNEKKFDQIKKGTSRINKMIFEANILTKESEKLIKELKN